jgi:hypothetical protein
MKNFKRMTLLLFAVVAVLAVSCKKEKVKPTPEPTLEPQVMNIVGTTWKSDFTMLVENTGTELDGEEITAFELVHVFSADSLHRISSMSVNGELVGGADFNTTYTWDGSTLVFVNPSDLSTFTLYYREDEDVFYRPLDLNDPQTAYFASLLGIEGFVFYRQ